MSSDQLTHTSSVPHYSDLACIELCASMAIRLVNPILEEHRASLKTETPITDPFDRMRSACKEIDTEGKGFTITCPGDRYNDARDYGENALEFIIDCENWYVIVGFPVEISDEKYSGDEEYEVVELYDPNIVATGFASGPRPVGDYVEPWRLDLADLGDMAQFDGMTDEELISAISTAAREPRI